MTDVVAALIWDGDRFLACQRPANKARGLLWEFVGGKVEPGETLHQALIRECREELAVEIAVGGIFMQLVHEYPDLTVRLTLFNAYIADGIPRLLEHNDIRWITADEIDGYSFCPADTGILTVLKQIHGAIQAELYAMAEPAYRDFQHKLLPTVDPHRVLGVRVPQLRKYAETLRGREAMFLQSLPHRYYDEDILHGILISGIDDFEGAVTALNAFLPHVDNWAVCDLINPIAFCEPSQRLTDCIWHWLEDGNPYTIRFAIGLLLRHYLGDRFQPEYLQVVANVHSEHYYVKMMVAWYFATALTYQYETAVRYLEDHILQPWIHNKVIQKAIESNRISSTTKKYLKTLKVKRGGGNDE